MRFPSNSVKYYPGAARPRLCALYITLCLAALAPLAAAQCPPALHPYDIQGAADRSPYEGQHVSITGTVTSVDWRRDGQQGLFLQGPPDRNGRTSDAVFVYAPDIGSLASQRPRRGQQWTVTGLIKEFHGLTEVSELSAAVRCGDDRPLPPAVAASGPAEALEGMRVQLIAPVIIDNYRVLHTGTVTVESRGSTWHLEDGSNQRSLDRLPWGLQSDPRLVANGTTLTDLTGVLTFRWNQWVIIPDNPPTPTQLPAWRWPAPETASLKLASWNLNNLFDGDNGDFSQSRRADSQRQWERQRAKTASALAALNADLIFLQEVEHDRGRQSTTALDDLATALNDMVNPGEPVYQAILPGHRAGDDAITTAFLYRRDRLTPSSGLDRIDTEPRASIRQSFIDQRSGREFTAVNVHLKSRNGCPGSCRAPREAALSKLANGHASTHHAAGTPLLLGGDFNTLAGEPSWSILRRSGWQRIPVEGPTYWYRGRAQQLDHFWWYGATKPEQAHAIPGQAEMPPIPTRHSLFDPDSPWGASDHNIIYLSW